MRYFDLESKGHLFAQIRGTDFESLHIKYKVRYIVYQ